VQHARPRGRVSSSGGAINSHCCVSRKAYYRTQNNNEEIAMRIAVLGGGPAGLYFSALQKTRHPRDHVTVFEQNPRGSTFGFGVVFSDRAIDFLRNSDAPTADLITGQMETWSI
jgi:hypothetical protein